MHGRGGGPALFAGTPFAAWAQVVTAASNVAGMKIAMIGAGREGSALGALFVKPGHQVMFSSRHPEQLKDRGCLGRGPYQGRHR